MVKIKIESNPYEQKIHYSRYDKTNGDYIPIEQETSFSKLVSKDFVQCFFPFKVEEILSRIIIEYGNELEIVFEGPSDEFEVLKQVHQTHFKNIIITKGEKHLENGQIVIQKIKNIFSEIRPILQDSVNNNNQIINQNLQQYNDTTNNFIPICVIGTTNVGKSTFINSLLGAEYLPNDKDRCTAKIYKIKQSNQSDCATIIFKYNNEEISISLKTNNEISDFKSKDFKNELQLQLSEMINSSLPQKVTSLLLFLNKYNEEHHNEAISPLIEITIPFNSPILQHADNPFIIFDTPGSNYAGNNEDLLILQHQMSKLTNGLIIYVSDYSGLSSNDNDSLISQLHSFNNIDLRFTMLIINKVDKEKDLYFQDKLSEEEETIIKKATVPQKLNNEGLQGIFFVSSFFGLGYKNHGSFLNQNDCIDFRRNVRDFDETDPYTKRLYKLNIIPVKPIQENTENIDAVYLNSGLYSIEKAIEAYATNYSSYNKCFKAYELLNTIIDKTGTFIEEDIKQQENSINNLQSEIDTNIKKLKTELHLAEKIIEKEYEIIKNNKIQNGKNYYNYFSVDDFQKIDNQCFKDCQINLNIPQIQEEYNKAEKETRKRYKQILENKKKEAEIQSFNVSLDKFYSLFVNKFKNLEESINNDSINDSTIYSEKLRNTLLQIIRDSESLTESEKNRLCGNIQHFESYNYKKQQIKDNLYAQVDNFKLGRFKFSDRINVKKVVNNFNPQLNLLVKERHKSSRNHHFEEFKKWAQKLLNVISDDNLIVENNTALSDLQNNKDKQTKRKSQITNNRDLLIKYKNEIHTMISFE